MMKKLSSAEIRETFLNYFARHNHHIVPSSSLLPDNDATLLFTNAGMVPFKEIFLGQKAFPFQPARACSAQRCMRASGKHNDLENVGYTSRHHTFFEMLGNFSFGDYFKREAIHYAWYFLTKEVVIDPARLWVTVHEKDDEAENLWREEFKKTGLSPQGLSRCGDKDNFWAMGKTGPCGYCSEIFYDHGTNLPGLPPPEEGGERYIEIWNLVFMQFERDENGNLTPLPKPSIDTGMGLERLAAVLQGVHDNYEIDLFKDLYVKFEQVLTQLGIKSSTKVNADEIKIAKRVVADHIRAATFLIADGALPSNEREGYVLRSVIRRASYYLYRLGINAPAFYRFVEVIVAMMHSIYPELELIKRQAWIANVVRQEEVKFLETLERGLKIFEQEVSKLSTATLPGEVMFTLHDTYGLPAILTSEITRQRGLKIDQEGFDVAMEKQRQMARASSKLKCDNKLQLDIDLTNKFVGYTENKISSTILAIFNSDGQKIATLQSNQGGMVILDKTPFYAESGGQVGDTGALHSATDVFKVTDTQKCGSMYVHIGTMQQGTIKIGDKINAEIDCARRQAIRCNHSATHLLHAALHQVLGKEATQRGSMVDEKRLRLDFAYAQALTPEQLQKIEMIVNTAIQANLEITTTVQSLNEAKKEGVMALFGEKYGEEVRVVAAENFSKELCGGTHLHHTGEIGVFKITSETGIAAGVRRIEAVTAINALNWISANEKILAQASALLKTVPSEFLIKLQQLLEEKRNLEKDLAQIKTSMAAQQGQDLAAQAITLHGEIKVLVAELKDIDSNGMRQTLDVLKQKLKSAVIVLATVQNDKIQLICGVTENLVAKIHAAKLLQFVAAQLGGKGGGRPDLAQGGGTDLKNLEVALQSVVPWIESNC